MVWDWIERGMCTRLGIELHVKNDYIILHCTWYGLGMALEIELQCTCKEWLVWCNITWYGLGIALGIELHVKNDYIILLYSTYYDSTSTHTDRRSGPGVHVCIIYPVQGYLLTIKTIKTLSI